MLVSPKALFAVSAADAIDSTARSAQRITGAAGEVQAQLAHEIEADRVIRMTPMPKRVGRMTGRQKNGAFESSRAERRFVLLFDIVTQPRITLARAELPR